MPRATRVVLLLSILVTSILVIVRVSEYKGYFAQHNANTYVVRLFAVLIGYVVAILSAGTLKGSFWLRIFRFAMIFGLASGLTEIVAIAAENNLLRFRVPQLMGMLSVFAMWGVAGLWTTLALKCAKAGVLTGIVTAGICMLFGVAGGVWLELFVAPANPAIVAGWQEFKRSDWTDPGAFQIANTLESASGHLVLAPVIATIFGAIGSGFARVLWRSRTRPAC